jgi:hypothetical protein
MSTDLAAECDGYRTWMAAIFSSDDDAKTNYGLWNVDKLQLNRYVTQFNYDIDSTISQHGKVKVADAIRFIYGSTSGYMCDVLDSSLGQPRIVFMLSLKSLYSAGFDRHCIRDFNAESIEGLNRVCFMLWDMDGVECPAYRGDPEMLEVSLDVLRFVLTLQNPACHKSALHGLGHLVAPHVSKVRPIIHDYLTTLSSETERDYAEGALEGYLQ